MRESGVKLEQMENKLKQTEVSLEGQKSLAVNRDRAVTPRPDWEEAECFLLEKKVVEPHENLPMGEDTKTIVKYLTDLINKIRGDLVEAKQDVSTYNSSLLNKEEEAAARIEQMEQAEKAGEKSKFLVCHGKNPGVPIYLRATGKVKNSNLSRQKIVAFLRDYWKEKRATKSSLTMPCDLFLDNLLKKRFGTERKMVEMSYNIIYGVGRFSFDADCGMFANILEGTMPQDAY